ncbi:MAG: hypothetical protein LBQ33_04510 [Oscillospiraceae bacterium]|jgi:Zn-dependent protease|nr:hypothetical protein [Oscillospiraceae bacterium]
MLALCVAADSVRRICLGLFFAALHEAGHLGVMAFFRVRPRRIALTAAGMRIDRAPGLRLSFRQEIAIALAGPAASLCLAALFACLQRLPGTGAPWQSYLLENGLWLNLGFGLLNLLPLRQLDGGRALYFALSLALAQRTANRLVLAASLLLLTATGLLFTLSCLENSVSMPLLLLFGYFALCCVTPVI